MGNIFALIIDGVDYLRFDGVFTGCYVMLLATDSLTPNLGHYGPEDPSSDLVSPWELDGFSCSEIALHNSFAVVHKHDSLSVIL